MQYCRAQAWPLDSTNRSRPNWRVQGVGLPGGGGGKRSGFQRFGLVERGGGGGLQKLETRTHPQYHVPTWGWRGCSS
jgi:hypothetical protein